MVNISDEFYSTISCVSSKRNQIPAGRTTQESLTIKTLPHPQRQGKGGLRTKGYFKKTFNDKPLISIITVVCNAQKLLEQTIQSVLNQNYDNLEYIIIDGGSTDGTLDIIQKYEKALDYWASEPDEGIYDAMNKGIEIASGEWLYFLGAGDVFYDTHVLETIFLSSKNLGSVVILFGNIIYDDERLFKSRYDANLYYRNTIHHQGAFYQQRLFDSFRYQTDCLISADYELNLMLFCNKSISLNVERIIAKCNGEGISNQVDLRGYIEEINIRHKYIGRVNSLKYDLMTLLRYLIKRLVKSVSLYK